MPRQIAELSIFVSCPSNLTAEREVISSAIDELNPILRDAYNVTLRQVNWEDLVPGIGSDAQSVINSQIDGKYDIYLGLLGERFGTGTPRAGSGTEEEFQMARQRYEEKPQDVRVLFYFKNTSNDLLRIDVEQLQKVIVFRQKLQNTGVFYHEFPDQDSLLRIIKDQLRKLIAEQWEVNRWKVLTPALRTANMPDSEIVRSSFTLPVEALPVGTEELEESEPGILDAIATAHASFAIATQSLVELTAASAALTTRITDRISELNAAKERNDLQAIKQSIDNAASDLEAYSTSVQERSAAFRDSFSEGLQQFEIMINIYFADKIGAPTDIGEMPSQLQTLLSTMQSGRESLEQFRRIIAATPAFTGKYKRAKRRAEQLLASFSASITILLDRGAQIHKNLLERMQAPETSQ